MQIEEFTLERVQSLYENEVRINLTESGIHPFTLRELLTAEEIDRLLDVRLGYGYTNGAIDLRDAVASYYKGATRDNVLITNGSAEANFLTVWSHLEPGDELILMQPNYQQIWGLARSFGIIVKPFFLREDRNWAPDIDALRGLITPKTKMISVCNPNNPTGAVLSDGDMRAISDIAADAGAWLHADEVYRGADLDGAERATFHDLYDKTLISGGLSKSLAHPGLRIGWIVADEAAIHRAWHHKDYTTITTCLLSETIATAILQPALRRKILERGHALLNANLKVLQDWIGQHGDLFHLNPPKAGGMAFIRYKMDINSTELTDRLRIEKDVLVVAGDCYGMDGFIRIGIGSETDYFIEGLELVDDLLREL